MKKIQHLILASVALASLATAVWAATTTTNTPGSQCVAAGSGTLSIRSDGEAQNLTSSTVTAVCPVERAIAPSLATKVSGRVFVVDRSDAANVCCKLVSKNAGGTTTSSPTVCSTGNSATFQQLVLAEITDPYSYSQFSVQCTVPPINGLAASRIQLYRTTQE